MEKCIHPECACEGYKQPLAPEAKGTLDCLLRRCCSGCGHMSSEHRLLTSVDTLVCKEVGVAGSRGCVQSIPVMDVPRSPIFRSHDPIYLPCGDFAQDCSVVCACSGFVLSNVVAVQQSFLGVAPARVREELGKTPCSFCHHPLSQHQGDNSANVSKGHPEMTSLARLKLKSLCQLYNMTTPFALTLDYRNRQFIFVCLCSSNELTLLVSNWDEQQRTDSTTITGAPVPMDTTENIAKESLKKSKKRRSSKKRNSPSVRRSERLEAQRIASEVESLESERLKEAVPKVPLEGAVRFGSDLKETSKWNNLGKLPNALKGPVGVVCCSVDDGVLIAVACQSGGAIGLAPRVGEMVWSTVEQNNYTCASLSESPEGVLISMGTDRGEVIVWQAKVEKMIVSTEILTKLQDPHSQITVLKWSPSGEVLAVGCFHGEVILYSYDKEELSLTQTLSVSGSSITSVAWSEDSRLLAVGGSDDCVQVIAAPSPVSKSPLNQPAPNNLFNYFPRLSGPQFRHTLSLKGHQSFVSDVLFTPSGLLLSLGWDGQLLMWNPSHDSHPHAVDSDPVGGFKIGPSLETQFLPLFVTAVNSGLLVTIRDKNSTLSVIHYSSII